MKRSLHLIVLAAISIAALPLSAQEILHVEPPHWWVGMQHNEIQLLVHGDGIAEASDVQVGNGMDLLRLTRVENPNYLFLDLRIEEGARPGKVPISFRGGRRTVSIDYDLAAREGFEGRIQGLDPSDLIYLIMPDRFANGDPSNDVVEGMRETELDRSDPYKRHGGDLKGIVDRLDYLQDLGVTTLWLNPAKENDMPKASYHGYAATDFYKIDERLGGNGAYQALVDACHDRGMKVIMDIIHNHVGLEHWFIRDLPSDDWIHQWPTFTRTTYRAPTLMDPYASEADRKIMTDGWFDHSMPDLNQSNPLVARYLIQNNLWWIEESGVDGFRMDTWAYADPDFHEQWSAAMLREYPHFGIFGETWVHGGLVQSYFHGNTRVDKEYNSGIAGLTDFQLYYAINEALTREPGWTEGVNRLYYTLAKDYVYRDPSRNVVFLDNHDLSRAFGVWGKDMRKYKMAIDWLMTVRGTPMIYYGTEILMAEEADAHAATVRQDFPGGWPGDQVNKFQAAGRSAEENEAFDYLRAMARWRSRSPVLHEGDMMQFVPEEGLYVYFRYDDSKTVMVIMNCSDQGQTWSPGRFAERLEGFSRGRQPANGAEYNLNEPLELIPRTSLVLELQR